MVVKKKKRRLPDGMVSIWFIVSEEEREEIRVAAALEGIPMSRFTVEASLKEARKINEKRMKP